MIVRFRRGNMAETRPVHGKLDHHVSAGRKRDEYKQLPVSVEFTKYGNTLFRTVRVKSFVLEFQSMRNSFYIQRSGMLQVMKLIILAYICRFRHFEYNTQASIIGVYIQLYIRDHRGKSKLFTRETRHNHKFLGSCELKAPYYSFKIFPQF